MIQKIRIVFLQQIERGDSINTINNEGDKSFPINEEVNSVVKEDTYLYLPRKKIEETKNCCQPCTKCIKDVLKTKYILNKQKTF